MSTNGPLLPPFEFDERKSRINKLKHGIDFVEAQAIWLDKHVKRVRADHPVETRFLVIGSIGSKHWTAVITYRGDCVRLISVRRSRARRWRQMDAEEFDRKFDEGTEDVLQYADMSSLVRPNRDVKRVSVDLTLWMVEALDNEAKRLGVTRQSVIKVWLSEKIDENWRRMEAERGARREQQTG